MGYFDRLQGELGKIKPPVQRRYNDNGVFILGILKTRMQVSTRLGKPDTFICDTVTLQSSNPAQEIGAKTQWAPSMAWDGTVRDIMSFIAAVAKCRFEQVTVAHMNAICEVVRDEKGEPVIGEDGFEKLVNPMYGRLVKVRVFPKQNDERKASGKEPFSAHDWYPCPLDIEPALLKKFAELTGGAK